MRVCLIAEIFGGRLGGLEIRRLGGDYFLDV